MAPPDESDREGVGVGVSRGRNGAIRDAISYLEGLRITQGEHVGEPFRVLPWQADFLRGALARGVYESALTMARGGGKTSFIAGLACTFLDGPLAQPNAEIAVCSGSLSQARIVFRHVLRFLDEKIKAKQFRVWDSVSRCALQSHRTGVLLELKGANPRTLHGMAPALVIVDELAQIQPNIIDATLAALDTGLGKIPGGRFWKIGTRAASAEHPFEHALATADYVQCHAAEPGDDPFSRETWIKACPSVEFFPHLEAKIAKEAEKIRRTGSEAALASFKALRLNLGVSDVVESLLVELEDWKRAEGDLPATGAPVWGVDLGTTAASSAVAAYWPGSGRLDVVALSQAKE